MFCSKCGSAISETEQFCSSCGQPKAGPQSGTGMPQPDSGSNGFSTAGIILGAIGFFFFPILLGPAGLILGGIAKSKNEPRANTALIISGIGLVGGMIFGMLVWATI